MNEQERKALVDWGMQSGEEIKAAGPQATRPLAEFISELRGAPATRLALHEMLIRHYGSVDEQADQRARYGLSDAELSCQIEHDAREALATASLPDAEGGGTSKSTGG